MKWNLWTISEDYIFLPNSTFWGIFWAKYLKATGFFLFLLPKKLTNVQMSWMVKSWIRRLPVYAFKSVKALRFFPSFSIADGSTSQASMEVASCKRMILETNVWSYSSWSIVLRLLFSCTQFNQKTKICYQLRAYNCLPISKQKFEKSFNYFFYR